MTTQDDIWRDQQAEWERQDRQVRCAKCEEWVREMDHNEHHPLPAELCTGCQENIDMANEEAA